jgi:hypothetical protein
MADKEKPYKLPRVGGRPKKRLSRAEFEELVRTMGARAAQDYMRDASYPFKDFNRTTTNGSEARATGMKNGGMVKAGKVAKFKNGGCVMAGRGVRNTKVL